MARKLLNELIYDKDTDRIVTFNTPKTHADLLEMVSLALDCLSNQKDIDNPNIKCFKLSEFRLIYSNPQRVLYIQEYPDKDKVVSII